MLDDEMKSFGTEVYLPGGASILSLTFSLKNERRNRSEKWLQLHGKGYN